MSTKVDPVALASALLTHRESLLPSFYSSHSSLRQFTIYLICISSFLSMHSCPRSRRCASRCRKLTDTDSRPLTLKDRVPVAHIARCLSYSFNPIYTPSLTHSLNLCCLAILLRLLNQYRSNERTNTASSIFSSERFLVQELSSEGSLSLCAI